MPGLHFEQSNTHLLQVSQKSNFLMWCLRTNVLAYNSVVDLELVHRLFSQCSPLSYNYTIYYISQSTLHIWGLSKPFNTRHPVQVYPCWIIYCWMRKKRTLSWDPTKQSRVFGSHCPKISASQTWSKDPTCGSWPEGRALTLKHTVWVLGHLHISKVTTQGP